MRRRLLILPAALFVLLLAATYDLSREGAGASLPQLIEEPAPTLANAEPELHVEDPPAAVTPPVESDAEAEVTDEVGQEPEEAEELFLALRVRGRVSHTSGASLEGEQFRIYAPLWQREFHELVVTLDHNGAFDARVEFEDSIKLREEGNEFAAWAKELEPLNMEQAREAVASRPWGLEHRLGTRSESRYALCTSTLAATPADRDDGTVNLGEVVASGGLVEIRPDGFPDQSWFKLTLLWQSMASRIDARWESGSKPVRMLLTPGRYFYELETEVADEAIEDHSHDLTLPGYFDSQEGGYCEVVIPFPKLEFVAIHVVSDAGPIENAEFWATSTTFGDLPGDRGFYVIGDLDPDFKGSILRTGRVDLGVNVRAKGYQSRWVPVPDGVSEMTIKLELEVEKPNKPEIQQGVIVSIELPDGFKDKYDIYLFGSDGLPKQGGSVSREWPKTTHHCHPGRWHVGVFGGARMGYPGGLISGLIEVDVLAGQFAEVVMPPPAAPPHLACRRVDLEFTCDGRPMTLYGEFRMPGGGVSRETRPRDVGPFPLAVLDSGLEVPLSITAPESGLVYGADLPARVCVTLSGDDAGLFARISRDDGQSAWSKFDENTAYLWLPAGPATLEVKSPNATVFEQTIEVPAFGALEFNVDNKSCKLHLLTDADDPDWMLYQQTPGGWKYCWSAWDTGDYTLLPGEYHAVVKDARYSGVRAVSVSSGQRQVVELAPDHEFETGEVFLPLPVELRNVPVQCDIDVVSAQLAAYMEGDISRESGWDSVDWRLAPGGVTLHGVPLGAALCFSGTVGDAHRTYVLPAHVVVVSPSDRRIEDPRWTQCRHLDMSPYISLTRLQWRASGTLPRVEGYTLPVGEVTVFLNNGSREEAFTITIEPGEGKCQLPEAAIARLREIGWLKDG